MHISKMHNKTLTHPQAHTHSSYKASYELTSFSLWHLEDRQQKAQSKTRVKYDSDRKQKVSSNLFQRLLRSV